MSEKLGGLSGGRRLKAAVVILTLLMVGVGVSFGLLAMRQRVMAQRSQQAVRYQLRLSGAPSWMPRQLHRYIARQILPEADKNQSFESSDLCRTIYQRAEENPWVDSVQYVQRVRRDAANGFVDVAVKFRKPAVRVQFDGREYVVDRKGFVLPARETPRWALRQGSKLAYYIHEQSLPRGSRPMRVHYPLMIGVQSPPPAPGREWKAADLKAGLKLWSIYADRPYANQISVLDVRNVGRRVSPEDPELSMYAQAGRGRRTEIRFGRLPHPDGGDYVVSPRQKLKYLDDYVADHGGKLAGFNEWLDLRYDELWLSFN